MGRVAHCPRRCTRRCAVDGARRTRSKAWFAYANRISRGRNSKAQARRMQIGQRAITAHEPSQRGEDQFPRPQRSPRNQHRDERRRIPGPLRELRVMRWATNFALDGAQCLRLIDTTQRCRRFRVDYPRLAEAASRRAIYRAAVACRSRTGERRQRHREQADPNQGNGRNSRKHCQPFPWAITSDVRA
jgi:hypothetical protein